MLQVEVHLFFKAVAPLERTRQVRIYLPLKKNKNNKTNLAKNMSDTKKKMNVIYNVVKTYDLFNKVINFNQKKTKQTNKQTNKNKSCRSPLKSLHPPTSTFIIFS